MKYDYERIQKYKNSFVIEKENLERCIVEEIVVPFMNEYGIKEIRDGLFDDKEYDQHETLLFLLIDEIENEIGCGILRMFGASRISPVYNILSSYARITGKRLIKAEDYKK